MIFARSGLVDVGDLHIGPYESGVFDIRGSRDYSITFHVLERNLTSQMDGLLGLGWEYVDVSIHVPEAILWLGWPELKPWYSSPVLLADPHLNSLPWMFVDMHCKSNIMHNTNMCIHWIHIKSYTHTHIYIIYYIIYSYAYMYYTYLYIYLHAGTSAFYSPIISSSISSRWVLTWGTLQCYW